MNDANSMARSEDQQIDEFVDKIMAELRRQGMGEILITMVDRVFRPFCKTLEEAQHQGVDPEEAFAAVADLSASMITSMVAKIVGRNDPETAIDVAQEMLDSVAVSVSGQIESNFSATTQ